jgi:hypothetical protein
MSATGIDMTPPTVSNKTYLDIKKGIDLAKTQRNGF